MKRFGPPTPPGSPLLFGAAHREPGLTSPKRGFAEFRKWIHLGPRGRNHRLDEHVSPPTMGR